MRGEKNSFPVDFFFFSGPGLSDEEAVEQFRRRHNGHLKRRSAQMSSTAAGVELSPPTPTPTPRAAGAVEEMEQPLGTFSHTHPGIGASITSCHLTGLLCSSKINLLCRFISHFFQMKRIHYRVTFPPFQSFLFPQLPVHGPNVALLVINL